MDFLHRDGQGYRGGVRERAAAEGDQQTGLDGASGCPTTGAAIRIPSAKLLRSSRNPCGGSDFRFGGRGRLTSVVRKVTFLLSAE